MNQAFCPNCEYDLSPGASFCANCGATIATYKYCRECGTRNPANARFCEQCRHTDFDSSRPVGASEGTLSGYGPSQPETRGTTASDVELDILLSQQRVIILSVVSGGLYFFWWMYRSWALLQEETGEKHFPVWHALTQLVPAYSLYRLYDHVSLIYLLRSQLGTRTSLNPTVIVTIEAFSWLLLFVSFGVSPGVSILITVIGTTIATVIVAWSQEALNEYWRYSRGEDVEEAAVGVGEVLLTILGAIFWIFAFVDL